MAVPSLFENSSSACNADSELLRGRPTMDQEKLVKRTPAAEVRSHNASPSQKTAFHGWKAKGTEKSSIELACTWIVEHQIGISFHILSLLFLTHICFPTARHHTQKFFSISYYNEHTNRFALGWDDIFFVFFWIIVFTGTRCATMDYVLAPLAAWAGINKKKQRVRFAEQAWITLYYGVFWTCGMYIWSNSPYWLNLQRLWPSFPTREMEGLTKWYYLVQFAFWLQQIVVVNIEERRKDHWQMFTHHIITCALIFTSYGYHQHAAGNVILCLMDIGDILLAVAKMLKYMEFTTICDVTFGVFMVSWFVARHIFYMMVCWSVYVDLPRGMTYGCFRGSDANLQGPLPIPNDWDHLIQPFYDPEGLICMNDNIRLTFLSLLLALQVLIVIWFGMILKVAYKVIKGQSADDVRSDDEDEEEKEETSVSEKLLNQIPEPASEKVPFIEQEVGVEEMNFKRSSSSSSRRKATRSPVSGGAGQHHQGGGGGSNNAVTTATNSTGVSLRPGDRKVLLGRIGCDKG